MPVKRRIDIVLLFLVSFLIYKDIWPYIKKKDIIIILGKIFLSYSGGLQWIMMYLFWVEV